MPLVIGGGLPGVGIGVIWIPHYPAVAPTRVAACPVAPKKDSLLCKEVLSCSKKSKMKAKRSQCIECKLELLRAAQRHPRALTSFKDADGCASAGGYALNTLATARAGAQPEGHGGATGAH